MRDPLWLGARGFIAAAPKHGDGREALSVASVNYFVLDWVLC
jgi:hypothetical protein